MMVRVMIFVGVLLGLLATFELQAESRDRYEIHFEAEFRPGSADALVTVAVDQTHGALKQLSFAALDEHFKLLTGRVKRENERTIWHVPRTGGEVQWRYKVDRLRGQQQRFEARMTSDHIIARLDDVFPNARARTKKGALGTAELSVSGPDAWSFESPFGPMTETIAISMNGRKYGRPSGWLIGGELSRRREEIAGAIVTVSSPKGIDARPMERLNFLQYTLPTLAEYLPMPERVSVVVVPDSMWRGAISGPNSIYINKGRPAVSENGTSTILHELAHVAGLHSAADGDDWIAEGMAEYLSVLTLFESGGMSQSRFDRVIAGLKSWVTKEDGRLADPSRGANTAAAVVLFDQLRVELNSREDGFLQLVGQLNQCQPISSACLSKVAESILGRPSQVLAERP